MACQKVNWRGDNDNKHSTARGVLGLYGAEKVSDDESIGRMDQDGVNVWE